MWGKKGAVENKKKVFASCRCRVVTNWSRLGAWEPFSSPRVIAVVGEQYDLLKKKKKHDLSGFVCAEFVSVLLLESR